VVAFLAPQGNPSQGPQPKLQAQVNQFNQPASPSGFSQAGGATAVVVAAGVASVLVGRGRTRRKGTGSVTVLKAFENELGVQEPVGFFDPLGLSADGDVEVFRRRRETEIKHGRISMLATMGYITPELVGKFPGYLSPYYNIKFEDVPNGLAAISKVPFFGWLQIGLYALYCEASGLGFGYFDANQEREPGNLGWKPPLLATNDPELRKKKLQAELANGRLAMMAIIGMFFQDGLTGSAWGDWANYTASPLR